MSLSCWSALNVSLKNTWFRFLHRTWFGSTPNHIWFSLICFVCPDATPKWEGRQSQWGQLGDRLWKHTPDLSRTGSVNAPHVLADAQCKVSSQHLLLMRVTVTVVLNWWLNIKTLVFWRLLLKKSWGKHSRISKGSWNNFYSQHTLSHPKRSLAIKNTWQSKRGDLLLTHEGKIWADVKKKATPSVKQRPFTAR